MATAYSRKQFLLKLLNDAVGFISAVRDDPGTACAETEVASRTAPAVSELCPSLLEAEAERMGVDPEKIHPEELRRIIYEALGRRCADQGGSGTGSKAP